MRTWVYDPKPQKVSDELKKEIETKADKIISILKEKHIKKPPKGYKYNYIVDIYYRWIGKRFYFCSKFNCPGPNAISPSFESKFARLQYTANKYSEKDKFQLFFMRHTGQWIKLLEDETLNKCFESIENDPWFVP